MEQSFRSKSARDNLKAAQILQEFLENQEILEGHLPNALPLLLASMMSEISLTSLQMMAYALEKGFRSNESAF